MYKEKRDSFLEVLSALPENIRSVLEKIPDDSRRKTQEICLRINKPVLLHTGDGFFYSTNDGALTKICHSSVFVASQSDIEETFHRICEYSVHSKFNEIQKGYITLSGGHRVGICGTAVLDNGKISTLKDISSLNIRISHEVFDCSADIANKFFGDRRQIQSLLIAGPPLSGKTTLLRDLSRHLSGGVIDKYRIAIIDERGEIAGTFHGAAGYDVGVNVDILNGYPKADGIQTAVRCFSPQIIISDEVSTVEEAKAVLEGMHSGVSFILTVHAYDAEDLCNRPCIVTLLKAGVFENILMLSGFKNDGKVLFKQYGKDELLHEAYGNSVCDNFLHFSRAVDKVQM